MSQKFKKGDFVRFDWVAEQIEYEKIFKIPFTVNEVHKGDFYSVGLSEDLFEEIITVQDSEGVIFAEIVEDDLILLRFPQVDPTEFSLHDDCFI